MPKKSILFLIFFFLTSAAINIFPQSNSSTGRSTQTDQQKVAVVFPSQLIDEKTSLIQGVVIAVYDGDTISLQDPQGNIYTIRMQGIDAPEGNQAYGQDSKEKLASLISGKTVIVVIDKKDYYDRYIGNVYFEGQDIGLLQIKAGMAWFFKRYADDQTGQNRKKYSQAEQSAQDAHIGLWEVKNPKPPWEFRGDIIVDIGNKSNDAIESPKGIATSNTKSTKGKKSNGKEYFKGPKGGCYYITSSGNKVYVDDKSLCGN